MEYIIAAAAAAALIFLVHGSFNTKMARRVLPVLLTAFIVRLVIHVLLMRSDAIDYGTDNLDYEARAMDIAAYWRREGFQFVTSQEISSLRTVAVPCHIFAMVIYLCGDRAPLACTAIIALIACTVCIVMYRFARLMGADESAAFKLLTITAFMPSFLLHTSDTYKDGFNAFLVIACLALVCSNAQRFDTRKLLALAPLLWALWHVRPYMVFMCALPLVFGIASARQALSPRNVAIFVGLLMPILILVGASHIGTPVEAMQEQLERGQSETVRRANAHGGSGVVFEDGGSTWSALVPKLAYTLLSPFPWMSGSLALQVAKIEAFVWYYLLYLAVRGARRLWFDNRRMLLILLLFIVPSTVVYATTVANIGLIFRQRMPIVMIVSLLSAIAWTKISRDKEQSRIQHLGDRLETRT